MRLVIALGGNALLKRGEALTAENQRRNMRQAAAALAAICAEHEVVIVHGNGPQVGLLALTAQAYQAVPPYPLDVLGAESQGMIGYVIAQEMGNAMPEKPIASLITQTIVSRDDPAFGRPEKPIGPVYGVAEATALAATHQWSFAPDGTGMRRVVASPLPMAIVELPVIRQLLSAGCLPICVGGGGVPVVRGLDGRLTGIEAVIDKDHAAAQLAVALEAEGLLILTDVDGVYQDWGAADQRALTIATPAQLRALTFARGSMQPKVDAAIHFAEQTGHPAMIGSLDQVVDVLAGRAGTRITR